MIRPIFLLTAASAFAGEAPVARGTFRIEKEFQATALPATPGVLELEPESWTSFVVDSLVPHGTQVKKGQTLISFEREDYDRRLEDLSRAVAKQEEDLKKARAGFVKLEKTSALQLEAAQRTQAQAAEDLAYFKETGRPAAEATAKHQIEGSRFRLAGEEEELKQLQAMYAEDDLTEETEEIILERQKFAVADAKFDLAAAERRTERTLHAELPRREEQLVQAAAEAEAALAEAEIAIPASVAAAKSDLTAAEVAFERQKTELSRLKADGKWLAWAAPADGILLHGGISEGEWKLGDLAKALRHGSSVPLHQGLLSVAPTGGALAVTADLDPALAAQLSEGTPVSVHPIGREDQGAEGSVKVVAEIPDASGRHHAELELAWEKDHIPHPTTPLVCRATVYLNEEAILLPANALHAEKEGWSVTVKLADGNTENRPVERGRVNGDKAEILSGVEVGQVVVTPE
ncbi:multidrug efflux pump subunit AcrA (membrane-fusion protein) [Haloferula luteola]|uniref:Multidrug efflux pump subunit AcrA (Membrane-fusion protein) n=1 Tax=Haloferula luteola TaxID=595692 RepID=A0A840VGF0_9BACT|nr:efflux RND transporter periplasmic adaptor subunit [Haloferula luteola]MBB5352899.1 multidrug efflux pump subunit AcrA (membrane-fusion protein) [Haloferula luteola]